MNPLRRILLGAGRFPEELLAELVADEPLLLEEGLSGSVTLRGYRAPRRHSSWSKEAASGAIAVTPRRLVVWAGRSKHIDLPLVRPFLDAIEVAVQPPDQVSFAYDAGRYDPSRSGRVEVRLRTAQAARVAELLQAAG